MGRAGHRDLHDSPKLRLELASYLRQPCAALNQGADGLTWTCGSATPVLERTDVPGSGGIHTIALADGPDGPRLLVESLIEDGSEVWLAELTGRTTP